MAHHKYSTKAAILNVKPKGESDVIISMITEELGLLRAVGKSMRTAHSKLRMSVQEGVLVTVSLVKGREVWRLTNSVDSFSYYSLFKGTKS